MFVNHHLLMSPALCSRCSPTKQQLTSCTRLGNPTGGRIEITTTDTSGPTEQQRKKTAQKRLVATAIKEKLGRRRSKNGRYSTVRCRVGYCGDVPCRRAPPISCLPLRRRPWQAQRGVVGQYLVSIKAATFLCAGKLSPGVKKNNEFPFGLVRIVCEKKI
jgi:hypothetical protein